MTRERIEFDPSIINSSNVYDYATEEVWIDGGVDSQVFHLGDWVLKKYNARGPSVEQVLLYQEVTNLVANRLRGYTADLGLFGKVVLEVEPIIKVFGSDKYNQAFSISKYVGGRRLKDGQNKTFDSFLKDLSSEIMEAIGYKGIELCAPNTKLNKINSGISILAKSTCTVTDICRYVEDLHAG